MTAYLLRMASCLSLVVSFLLLPLPLLGQETPDVSGGVEVLARGPVHEAFATPMADARATPLIPKKPPLPLEEMPPEEKPEGNCAWIGGYWAWDDERQDFLWVSGCWRAQPTGQDWVAGYWREQGGQWQWVPGFWTELRQSGTNNQELTYYPEPPPPPQLAPPGHPPAADMFYVPGHWVWHSSHYVWRAGHWLRVRPGNVYVASHYRWTPFGFVFIPGFWDLALARRGILYAPVVVDPVVVGAGFVYTPRYAVCDAVLLDALFVRPAVCHYYFGDYYGPRYRSLGFEAGVVYSRRCYDPFIAYQRWECRHNPRWFDLQINLVLARDAGRAPCPPRTLVQQNNIVQQNITNLTKVTNVTNVTNTTNNLTQVLAPAKAVTSARGQNLVPVDAASRTLAKETAQSVQQASLVRQQSEAAAGSARPTPPRVTRLKLAPSAPPAQPSATSTSPPSASAAPQAAGMGKTSGKPASGPMPGPAGKPGTTTPLAGDTRPMPPAKAATVARPAQNSTSLPLPSANRPQPAMSPQPGPVLVRPGPAPTVGPRPTQGQPENRGTPPKKVPSKDDKKNP